MPEGRVTSSRLHQHAKNIIRGGISTFLLVLIIIASAGMRWAGSHLPPAQAVAGRVVLTLCILAGVIGLVALWRPRLTR